MSTDTDTTDRHAGTPTATSTVLSLVAGLCVVGLLRWQAGLALAPMLVGSGGALCFAVGLWLVGQDRWGPIAPVLAGLLALPVALGVFVAVFGTALVLASASLPVGSAAALSVLTLTVIARVGIVAGCVFAVLGLALGVRNVVDADTVSAYFQVCVQTAVVPGLVGVVLAGSAVLSLLGGGVGTVGVLDGIGRWLFAPNRLRTHVGTLLALVAVASLTLRAAIRALPVAELFGDGGAGETDLSRLDQLQSALGLGAVTAGLLCAPAVATETLFQPVEIQRLLGMGLYTTVAGLSAAQLLRSLLVLTAVGSTGILAASVALKRAATSSGRTTLRRAGPFVAGGLLTAAGVTFGRPLVDAFVAAVGVRLPAPFDDVFFESTSEVVATFGASTLVVVATTFLLVATVVFVVFFRLAVFTGYLSAETAGYSLASAGLFVAAAFAGTVVTEAWVLFAALVGVFFVWDMGQYGTTMGTEVGRNASTRDAELVHAGGTLAVGAAGVGAAYALQRALAAGTVGGVQIAVVALVGVLAGIVFLVTALR